MGRFVTTKTTQTKVARPSRRARPLAEKSARGRPTRDADREERIQMQVVVDAYDASERAMGWFAYLENELEFPFTARCTHRRPISPLLAGDEVDVLSMAPAEECGHEIFVTIQWKHGGLAVPLSQLEPKGAGRGTGVAIADWRYWVRQGYEF
jgi:hypothetical protein